jgi:Protein of unknown function (DUF2490)
VLTKKTAFGLLMIPFYMLGQKSVINQKLVWYGYYNTIKFNEKWQLSSEIQERQFINPTAQHQLLFRTNLVRSFNKNWNTSLGMTYFLQNPNDPESKSNLTVPELRPNIGFGYKKKILLVTITNRFKAEARFFHDVQNNELVGGYRFSNYRLRYELGLELSLLKTKQTKDEVILMKIKDEIMFNLGSKMVTNAFDQNRIYLGLNYKLNKAFAIEAGYLNWYQKRASGNEYYNRDILRLSVFHTIDLKNKNHE